MVDETDMLLAMHTGDEAAARWVWDRHFARLRAYVFAMCFSEETAQDVAQQVFLRVLEVDIAQVRRVKDAPAWLTRLARNIMFNTLRGERRARHRDTQSQTVGGPGMRTGAESSQRSSASSAAAPPIALGELLERVGRLSDEHREVVILKHVAGLSFEQIADALDEPRTTVASRHQAALAALRRMVQPETHPPGEPVSDSHEPRRPVPGMIYRGRDIHG